MSEKKDRDWWTQTTFCGFTPREYVVIVATVGLSIFCYRHLVMLGGG